MILLPAIDLQEGRGVHLFQGDYSTVEVVAPDPVETARKFHSQGARWLHLVDLDGALEGKPRNDAAIFEIAKNAGAQLEVGGGIRDMGAVEHYLENGVDRVILGSAALNDPELVRSAVGRYGEKIAIGVDALDGKVAAEGWTSHSEVDYLELGRRMEDLGVQYIILTDISKGGSMDGPNLVMLDKLNRAVSCNIIASGGVSSLLDLAALFDLGLYGAVSGKAIYNGALDLRMALAVCKRMR